MIVLYSKTNLLEIVTATHPSSSFAGGLNSGQQEPNQHTNDCNYNEKFHQCETSPTSVVLHG
jgi:hypothetical protein